jgi:uncharacterized phage infection (PIP) family protein YhgE
MKKVTVITSQLSIIALILVIFAETTEAQQPRPLLKGPDFEQVREVRTGAIKKALNAREEIQDSYQERRVDLQENRSEARENMQKRRAMITESFEDKRSQLSNRIEERKSRLQARREEMLKNQETRKAKLSDERKERVEKLFDNMFMGFANASERLFDVQNRLEAKVSELEEANQYVDEANSLLDTAESLLNDTVTEIEAIQTELNEAVEGEITKEYIRELVAEAKESIRATHEAYRAVIAEINQ